MNIASRRTLRHNITVNVLDGAFFGFANGFASYVVILPLFVSTLTDSPFLIGLIPAIHNTGWQLPQLFIAGWLARQARIKPLAISFSTIERLPYLGLALVAFLLPTIGVKTGLIVFFALWVVQGLGAGLTANPWQTLIAKIIPGNRRGAFLGLQAGSANLLASVGAALAGQTLAHKPGWEGYGWCFLIASGLLAISWVFLALTREEPLPPLPAEEPLPETRSEGLWRRLLRADRRFGWFLAARLVSQFTLIGFGFYAVYAVQQHGVSKAEIGLMTSALMAAQIAANIGMGWAGDRLGHRRVMEFGLAAMALSALLAVWAPSGAWFYLVFILAASGNVAIWNVGVMMTLEFGLPQERPAYIGLANTLIAPANILAPFLGGWLASAFGYPAAFAASATAGLAAAAIFHLLVGDARRAPAE